MLKAPGCPGWQFLTADTEVPDPLNPKALYRYAFAGGNPIRYVDPTGHGFWDILFGIFIAIFVIIVVAVTGGVQKTIAGIVSGGSPEELPGGICRAVGVGAAIGMVTTGIFKGITELMKSFAKYLVPALFSTFKALNLGYAASGSVYAGSTGRALSASVRDTEGWVPGYYYMDIITKFPTKPVGVPAWAYGSSGPSPVAPALQTMPLTPCRYSAGRADSSWPGSHAFLYYRSLPCRPLAKSLK